MIHIISTDGLSKPININISICFHNSGGQLVLEISHNSTPFGKGFVVRIQRCQSVKFKGYIFEKLQTYFEDFFLFAFTVKARHKRLEILKNPASKNRKKTASTSTSNESVHLKKKRFLLIHLQDFSWYSRRSDIV